MSAGYSRRLRRSAAMGAMLTALTGLPVWAQEAPSAEPVAQTPPPAESAPAPSGDVITVTGSRLKMDTFSSPSPMSVVSAEDAQLEGVQDIASLLQQNTAAAGSSQVTAALSVALANPQGGLGAQTLSLRGLGAQRTLVLLNGRRAGPAGVGGAVGPFDLNVVPLSAVERVEILKDGASSLYGSDAIAGVVNIITKTGSGSSLDFSYTAPEQGAAEELQISGTWGLDFDQGYFRISGDYFLQKEFDRGDRDYFFCGQLYYFRPDGTRADPYDPRRKDYACRDDVIWGHNWTYDYGENGASDKNGFRHRPWQNTAGRYQYDYSGQLAQYLLPFTNAFPAPSGIINPPGWYPVGYSNILLSSAKPDPIFGPYAKASIGLEDFYHPFMNDITLSPEIERASVVMSGEYDLNDDVTLYGEALLNRRSTREDGYSQIYTFQYQYRSGNGPIFGDPMALAAGWSLRDDSMDYYYVFHSPTAITDHADSDVQVDYLRVVGGAKGEFTFGAGDWDWDLSAQFSRSDGTYVEAVHWVDAITDYEMQTSLCAGTTTRYRKVPCVDVNWYSPDFNYGKRTAAEKAFLEGYTTSTTVYEQTTLEGYLSGQPFSLPAGKVGTVLGFQYQEDSIADVPDKAWIDKEVWSGGPTQRGITAGTDETRAIYGEISLPLIKNVPGIYDLNVNLSGRWTDVKSYGDDTTYKVGLSWAITPDIRVRASQGTSFRAPSLYELYLAQQVSRFAQSGDPCAQWGVKLQQGQITQRIADNCRNDPKFPGGIGPTQLSTGGIQATVYTSGGFGTLSAETSESKTIGVVWTPDFADLQISVDYYDIFLDGQVGRVSTSYLLRECYNSPNFPNDPLCKLFTRKQPGESPPGPLKDIYNNYLNIAAQTSRGVDFEAQYSTDIPWGDLDITLRAARQLESGEQLLPGSPFEDDNGWAGEPEWVGNLNTTLTRGPWTAFWGVRYVSPTSQVEDFEKDNPTKPYTYLNQPVVYVLDTPEVFYHSLSIGYEWEDLGVSARAGVRNVFDKMPPIVSANAGYYRQGNSVIESQYDLFGRTFFVNLSKTF